MHTNIPHFHRVFHIFARVRVYIVYLLSFPPLTHALHPCALLLHPHIHFTIQVLFSVADVSIIYTPCFPNQPQLLLKTWCALAEGRLVQDWTPSVKTMRRQYTASSMLLVQHHQSTL